jgi:glycine betaine/proline transport system permease protein
MDALSRFIEDNKIGFGRSVRSLTDWLTENFHAEFRAFSDGLAWLIEGFIDLLAAVPPVLLIALVAAFAWWLHRSLWLAASAVVGLVLILNLGYWEPTIQTIALVLFATVLCMVIGVPVGIYAAHNPWFQALIRPVLDLMQTIPTFVYLIPTLMLFGLGVVPGLISTVIFAIPAPIRLTALGVRSVPRQLIEAGEAFGATRAQLLFKVELPHALPTIMAGVTQCIMLSLSMVVIAALVGADGLGKPVVRALNTVNIAQGFEAGLAIVIVAILMDRLMRQRQPRGGADAERCACRPSASTTWTWSSAATRHAPWRCWTRAWTARQSSIAPARWWASMMPTSASRKARSACSWGCRGRASRRCCAASTASTPSAVDGCW